MMDMVTLSPKFQVVIPLRIRKALKLKPGQKIQMIRYGSRIELIPVKELSELRGFVKDIDTNYSREDDRV